MKMLLDDLIDYSGGRFGFFVIFILPITGIVLSLCGAMISAGSLLGWWA
jgi:hypothetical protein